MPQAQCRYHTAYQRGKAAGAVNLIMHFHALPSSAEGTSPTRANEHLSGRDAVEAEG